MPLLLERDEWELAVGRSEDDALHGDAGFLAEPMAGRDPWDLDPADVRLDPHGPAADLGPDLDRIPDPPPPLDELADRDQPPGEKVLDRLRRLLPKFPVN